jgi:thiamine monophosphate kinase
VDSSLLASSHPGVLAQRGMRASQVLVLSGNTGEAAAATAAAAATGTEQMRRPQAVIRSVAELAPRPRSHL